MDDIEPVPHAGHAAILRSPLAHARIDRLDPRPALEVTGVLGVLTGEDVVELSRPFPVGVEGARPYYAAAHDVARYVGEPLAVVVARDRYTAEDAAELIEVEYEPLEPVMDPAHGEVVPTAPSRTARSRTRSRRPTSSSRARTSSRAGRRARWRRTASSPTGTRPTGRSPRGRTSRAPSPSIPSPPRRSASGLEVAAHHAIALGRQLRRQGHCLRVRRPAGAGVEEARHPGPLDRGPARAPHGQARPPRLAARRCKPRSPRTASCSHSATTRSRTSARTSGRPSRRRSTGCTGRWAAPIGFGTSPPETASSSRTAVPPASTAASAARSSTSPWNGRWTPPPAASSSTRPSYEGATSSSRTRSPTARPPARSTTRVTTRPASTRHSSSLGMTSGVRNSALRETDGRLVGIGLACVVEPSISNMGYITLAQTAAARAETLPKSGNVEGATVAVSPLGGVTVRVATTPQGQGHETVCAQIVADALGVAPEDVQVVTDMDTSTSAWSVSSGNYSSRFSGVPRAPSTSPHRRWRPKLRRFASTWTTSLSRCGAWRESRTGTRQAYRLTWSRVSTKRRSAPSRTSSRRTRRTAWRRRAPTASSPTSPSSRSTGRPARFACSTT